VFDGDTLTWKGNADPSLEAIVRSVAYSRQVADRALAFGIGETELGELLAPPDLESRSIEDGEESNAARVTAALLTSVAIFMLIQIWGSFMTMGVVEEKSSRVVEVLLAQVDAATLLTGKALGLGLLAASQMLIMIVAALLGGALFYSVSLPTEVWAAVPTLLTFFVLGLVFYLAMFAAVGTLVSRQEDVQGVSVPASLPLIVGYIITASGIGDPSNPVATVASFIPFTSPVVMPFRAASGAAPVWQIVVAAILLLLGTRWMLRVASRIYRMLLLRTGTRVRWREALKVAIGLVT